MLFKMEQIVTRVRKVVSGSMWLDIFLFLNKIDPIHFNHNYVLHLVFSNSKIIDQFKTIDCKRERKIAA